MERLPDTAGLLREVVMQAPHRYKYDRAPTVAGAVLREAGDAAGATAAQGSAALGPHTAAVLFPAHLDGRAGTVPLDKTLALAHDQGVPVLVDAASADLPGGADAVVDAAGRRPGGVRRQVLRRAPLHGPPLRAE